MSADNWAKCPQCKRIRLAKIAAHSQWLVEMYGKVPMQEYVANQKSFARLQEQDLGLTLREDFTVGVTIDGLFWVSYSAHCSACKWRFEHKHDESALPQEVKL